MSTSPRQFSVIHKPENNTATTVKKTSHKHSDDS